MSDAAKNARQKAKRRALYEYFLARKLARMERKIDAANKRADDADGRAAEAERKAARMQAIVDNVFYQGLALDTVRDQRLRSIDFHARYRNQRQAIPDYQRAFDAMAYHAAQVTMPPPPGMTKDIVTAVCRSISDLERYGCGDARELAFMAERIAREMGESLARGILTMMANNGIPR